MPSQSELSIGHSFRLLGLSGKNADGGGDWSRGLLKTRGGMRLDDKSVIQDWVGIAMTTVLGGDEEFSEWGGAVVVAKWGLKDGQ
ncbi:hypothetical protein BY996DRAFT_6569436 [Phakopsora pachyrhizi]|nr:hypothetical protein BY996DRAFT_6569436 [Phakopsora pachyrhizi]